MTAFLMGQQQSQGRYSAESDSQHAVNRWLSRLTNGLLLLAMGLMLWLGGQYLTYPVSNVKFQGDVIYVEKDALRAKVDEAIANGFLLLDAAQLRTDLEQLSWVESAVVKRVWPDILIVELVENRPIARWGELALINAEGELFTPETMPALNSLPLLQGDEKKHKKSTLIMVFCRIFLHNLIWRYMV